jgi:hypothetical protein
MTFRPKAIFERSDRYDGVRPINIYLLRLLYVLMFFVLGKAVWTHILTHKGVWEPADAVQWCVWAAFATLAGVGILRPVKMLPIVLLEIFYKVPLAGVGGIPAVVNGHIGGFTRGGDYRGVPVGDPAHRRRAVGVCVRNVRLHAEAFSGPAS